MRKPHVHAVLICEWARGAVIEAKLGGNWQVVSSPTWDECREYRIQPEPTDLEKYGVEVGDVWSLLSGDLVLVESVGVELFEGRSLRIGAGQIFRRNSNCSTLIFRRGEVNKL